MPKLPKLEMHSLSSLAALLLVLLIQRPAAAQTSEPADAFSEAAASKLLGQLAEGLHAHNSRKLLGVFDLSRMDGAPIFKEQITAFFNQYESIRVHFKLMEVKENIVTVDAEIDATPPDGQNPPQHKSAQLRFAAAKTPAGWKFIDLQPRSFFS